jgi:hypothetical protein
VLISPESDPSPVDAPPKASPIRCTECSRIWLDRHEHWQAYIAAIDGTRIVGLFCPHCVSHEFEDH